MFVHCFKPVTILLWGNNATNIFIDTSHVYAHVFFYCRCGLIFCVFLLVSQARGFWSSSGVVHEPHQRQNPWVLFPSRVQHESVQDSLIQLKHEHFNDRTFFIYSKSTSPIMCLHIHLGPVTPACCSLPTKAKWEWRISGYCSASISKSCQWGFLF